MPTSWCYLGQHDKCPREWERWIIDPKTNKPVMLNETYRCDCKKRGCKCYVKPADRPKTRKRTPRRKK